ncbi:MAG: hypothetical protein E7339_00345 [Clostridiales bacterium]|nr:hypothetical protein [Clostridiales bacterium]
MKKFRLIALAIVCILSMACFFACDKDNSSIEESAPQSSIDETPAHVCEFGDWQVVTAATCAAEGTKQRVCIAEGCDKGVDGAPKVETDAIEKLPHTWDNEKHQQVTASTCAVKGEAMRTCTVCGYEDKIALDLLPHTWNHEELIHDEAYGTTTCTFAGKKTRTCTVCEKEEAEFEALLPHNLVDGVCSLCGLDATKSYTYKTYTAVSPSNWNELTYRDNNDTQIMSYLGSPFFEADFDFGGKEAKEENIVPGGFTVKYSFAKALEDITSQYVGKYGIEEGDTSLVWKITIREDGKWQNGDPIVAEDFVYTMKEQLNPLFRNYRADSYYAGTVNLFGAREYVYQGHTVVQSARYKHEHWDEAAMADSSIYFDLDSAGSGIIQWLIGNGYGSYVDNNGGIWLLEALGYLPSSYTRPLQGKTYAEIMADENLTALFNAVVGWWKTLPDEELDFFCYNYTYPAYAWAAEDGTPNVGIWAASKYEIVLCLTKGIELLDADGNLTYHCFYEFSSLPLVHKATYEANKVAPATEGGLWTSTYNSSLESTMSWGPYKLTAFQAGKYYSLEKNTNWYGYTANLYPGQYQTTRIECETITSYETAFLKFLSGELTGIGIDVAKAPTYKHSERAYFTPDDYVDSIQLQSDRVALEDRQEEGINKLLLIYKDFRKALSLSINRTEYTSTCTTSSLPGFGIFNSMHYHDVANGGVYRNTDVAKQVICNVYGVDVDEYFDLDEAYAAVTGYDLAQAKELLTKAYNEALANEDIKATDKVVLTYGASVDNETVRRRYEYLKKSFETLAVGTPLEGRLTCDFDASFGSKWADDFRDGAYDICQGGWSGAAWDPGYFLMAYVSPDYMYSTAWATDQHETEITVHGVKVEEGKYVVTNNAADSFTATMPIYGDIADEGYNTNWYQLLNNEFRDGVLNNEFRLEMIGGIEQEILGVYYTVPVSYNFGASLISYQVDYITYEYNTFNAYGGIQYMTYHYSDADWAAYVKANGLDYTV